MRWCHGGDSHGFVVPPALVAWEVPAGCGQVLEFATFRRHKAPALARADSSKARPRLVPSRRAEGRSESLKVSERCGWRPKDRQMRETVIGLSPDRFAICRVLQCVAPFGLLSSVRVTTCSTFLSETLRGAPGRGSSNNPSIPRAMNRDRHFPTVRGDTLSLAATTLLSRPRAQLSTIADRTARPCAVLRRRR